MFLQQDDLLEGRDYLHLLEGRDCLHLLEGRDCLHLLEGRYDLLDRRSDSFSWHKIWNASVLRLAMFGNKQKAV